LLLLFVVCWLLFLLVALTETYKFSTMTLDGKTFCSVGATTITQLIEALLVWVSVHVFQLENCWTDFDDI
jgi:hypothetical protein